METCRLEAVEKVVIVMAIGIFGGFFLKNALAGYDAVLYKFLGIFVIFLAIHGFYSIYGQRQRDTKENHHGNQCCYLLVRE